MFYISLPYLCKNYKFNWFFKEYVEYNSKTSNSKLIAPFNIEYVYGSFPWSFWNGGINNHQGKAMLTYEMEKCISESITPIRIEANNIYLQESDYYDIHENAILKVANYHNVSYEISNIGLMEYISKYNLNNRFIIANSAQLINLFNTDIINIFQTRSEIDFINLGYNSIEQLKENIDFSLIDKKKIEISIGHCQKCSYQQCLNCINTEQKNIYDFSKRTLFNSCPLQYNPNNYYEEIIPFLSQGIQHFKIIPGIKNLEEFNYSIIQSFVKPEYQGECLYEYYRSIAQ